MDSLIRDIVRLYLAGFLGESRAKISLIVPSGAVTVDTHKGSVLVFVTQAV